MRGREPLYRRLGVTDTPTAHHHAALLLEIASQAAPAPDDVLVHEHCLAWLADALDRDDRDVPPALEALQDKPALLNLLGEPDWHDEAAWRDSVAMAQPFAGERSEGRRVGDESVSTCRSWWSPCHQKTKSFTLTN